MAVPADDLIESASGAMATVRKCRLCEFSKVTKKGIPGVGRGYGMREGNKARGLVIQHIKAEHPTDYKAAMDAAKRKLADAKLADESAGPWSGSVLLLRVAAYDRCDDIGDWPEHLLCVISTFLFRRGASEIGSHSRVPARSLTIAERARVERIERDHDTLQIHAFNRTIKDIR